jgi:hypothetical protein
LTEAQSCFWQTLTHDRAGTRSNEIADAITRGIQAANKQTGDLLRDNRTALENSLKTLHDEQVSALAATTDQAKKALQATINNAQLEQRAWVGPSAFVDPTRNDGGRLVYAKVGEPVAITLRILNSGRTFCQETQ